MIDRIINKLRFIWRNEFWKKLAKNVSTVLVGNGGSAILNFLLTILMIRVFGNTKYGIFVIALQYMNLIDGVVNFQSWAGVIKYGCEALVQNDENRLCSIIKSGFLIDFLTAILGALVAAVAIPIASILLGWTEEIIPLSLIFSIEILFHIEGTSVGILRLFDKFRLTATQSIISALIKIILIGGYCLFGGSSLLIITILYVIADIIKHLMLVVMALRVLSNSIGIKKVWKSPFRRQDNKAFLSYTIWNNVSYTLDVPVRYFDIFIISMISVEMVSVYKVFQQIFQVISMLTTPISTAILPQFSELIAKKRLEEAYKKMLKMRNAILALGVGVIALSLICAKPIISLVFGTEYGQHMELFMVMLIMNVFLMSYVSIHSLMQGLGRAKVDMVITLMGNIAYCVIAYALVGILGIYAVIVAKFVAGCTVIYGKQFFIKSQIEVERRIKE